MNFRCAGTWIYDVELSILKFAAIDFKHNRGFSLRMTISSIFTNSGAASDVDDAGCSRNGDFARVNSQLFWEMQAQMNHSPDFCNALASLVAEPVDLVAIFSEEKSERGREKKNDDFHFQLKLFNVSFADGCAFIQKTVTWCPLWVIEIVIFLKRKTDRLLRVSK